MKATTAKAVCALLCLLSVGDCDLAAVDGAAGQPLTPRIVGGREVSPPGKYSFMVSIQDSAGFTYCGGSLISPRHVMTAAHCVVDTVAADVSIVLGRHDITTSDGLVLGVSRIDVHPAFDMDTFGNDIAVLTLIVDAPPLYTPVRLSDNTAFEAPGTSVLVIGWGATREGDRSSVSNVLLETGVSVVSNTQCYVAYPGTPPTLFCAGWPTGGKDACQGDSGGPLFLGTVDGHVQGVGAQVLGPLCHWNCPALAVSQLYPILHTASHPYINLLSVVNAVSHRVTVPHQVP